MDGEIHVFGPAYSFIDGKLEAFLDVGTNRIIAEVAGPLRFALVLYVVLYGFAILRGAISEPVMDFAIRSMKLALIYFLATTAAYGDWVTQPLFHQLPDTLAHAITGGPSGEAGMAFDQFLSRGAYLGDKIAKTANALDPMPWLLSACVVVIGAISAALGFGIVTLAKVALALLVSLGPVFLACSLFEATRRYFFGWLSQAINYLVLFALIIAMFQLVLALVGDRWGEIDGNDPTTGGLLFIALCLFGGIFFLQTPAIAAGIAGGASIGLADFSRALSGHGGGARTAAVGGDRGFAAPQGGSIRQVRSPR